MDFSIKQGQLITLTFEGKSFEAIVIDPNSWEKVSLALVLVLT